ncbi:hypothetical protein ACFOYW_00530 [Gryllotalpicola reticulitermitis]|uniref:Uncharacterized protein n=1 Tax=Gryllotalpicola reticulitermitis TaxID=1184153 RepID=A0ABV8Q025_9MICO
MSRLVTFAELDPRWTPAHVSVAARLELELDDGRRVLLLDDRGWSSSLPAAGWAGVPIAEIEATARMVVGPDAAYDGWTAEQIADGHWATIARLAASRGAAITGDELRGLRHDVVIGPRLRALRAESAAGW